MTLYLVQHAEALTEEEDPSRSLSENGIKSVKKVAAFVSDLRIEVHQIIHSGKMRALQTAQILAESVTSEMGVVEADGLTPKEDPKIWLERLSESDNDLMLVGHMPHLARLSSLLLRGNEENRVVEFEMGGIVRLKKSREGTWSVDWIIKPRMLKQ